MIPDKITFRPGSLSGLIEKKLAETGEKPSAYIRRIVAEDCGVEPPKMDGNLKTLKQFAAKESKRTRKRKRN